jgi:hypothetical protein
VKISFLTFRFSGLQSCIQICKSTSSVDSCHCRLTTGKEPHLVFELTSIGGQLRKQHILRIEECEVFQAVYNRNSTLLRVVTEANPIVECLSTLGSKMDDCQLTLLAEGLQMASPLPSTPAFLGGFSSSASASEKTHVQLRSETVLERSAFVEYPSGQAEHLPLTVTVGTKALKAALLLWEQWNCRVELCLSSPGAPMLLAMCDSVAGMQGEVLIATVDCSRLEREDPSQLLPPKSKQPTSPFPSLTHPTASGSGSVSVSGGRGRGLSPPLSPPPMGDNRDSDSDSEGGDLVGPTPSPTPP